jgi:tRNA(fMet)-specific endonuclease VapC
MNVCIDTCAYAGMRRGNRNVSDIIACAETVRVPMVVLGELFAGFQMGRRARQNEEELDRFLALPEVIVQDIDRETAVRYGFIVRDLRAKGTPIPTNDIWIAASAMVSGARLLTLDPHFAHVPGLVVVDLGGQ